MIRLGGLGGRAGLSFSFLGPSLPVRYQEFLPFGSLYWYGTHVPVRYLYTVPLQEEVPVPISVPRPRCHFVNAHHDGAVDTRPAHHPGRGLLALWGASAAAARAGSQRKRTGSCLPYRSPFSGVRTEGAAQSWAEGAACARRCRRGRRGGPGGARALINAGKISYVVSTRKSLQPSLHKMTLTTQF